MNENDKNKQVNLAFENANETDSFKVHNDFLNSLLINESDVGCQLHYSFFKNATNKNLKRILGKGFLKRGEKGFDFLLKKLTLELDTLQKSNVIHLLGLSHSKRFLPNILPFLNDTNWDIRYKAIVSIGWIGDESTITNLENHYSMEKANDLRGFTITAMRQIYFRFTEAKDAILKFLFNKIKTEKSDVVIAIIIVVIQDLTKIKYGLKEDPSTGELSGDISTAKEKLFKKLHL